MLDIILEGVLDAVYEGVLDIVLKGVLDIVLKLLEVMLRLCEGMLNPCTCEDLLDCQKKIAHVNDGPKEGLVSADALDWT